MANILQTPTMLLVVITLPPCYVFMVYSINFLPFTLAIVLPFTLAMVLTCKNAKKFMAYLYVIVNLGHFLKCFKCNQNWSYGQTQKLPPLNGYFQLI